MPDLAYQATPKLSLDSAFRHSLHNSNGMALLLQDTLGRILHLEHFNRIYLNLRLDCGEADFVDRALECLGIKHDGLVFVDMLQVDPRVLTRLMGKEMAEAYLAFHGRADGLKLVS